MRLARLLGALVWIAACSGADNLEDEPKDTPDAAATSSSGGGSTSSSSSGSGQSDSGPEAGPDGGAEPAATTLDLNDVSILLPLPRTPAERAVTPYMLQDGGTPWMTLELAEALPSLFSTQPGSTESIYRSMQIVAVRLVPCAPAASGCTPEFRATGQVVGLGDGGLFFEEVAIHLLFALTPSETTALAGELLALKRSSPVATTGTPLYVHPALENGGMDTAWGTQLRDLIARHARLERLHRVTTTGFVFDSWPFRAVTIEGGRVVAEEIVPHMETEETAQTWDIFGDDDVFGNIRAASSVEKPMASLVVRSFSAADPAAPAVRAAADSVERVLNPNKHSPTSVDCVSCHAARFAKAIGLENGVSFQSNDSYQAPAWANLERRQDPRIELANANVVQFGWFLRAGQLPTHVPLPSVGERVIHESAEAAKLATELLAP